MESSYKSSLQEFLYTNHNKDPDKEDYTITSISLQQYEATSLTENLGRFSRNYNLSLVSPLPEGNINVTTVLLQGNKTSEPEKQYCFIDDFNVSQLPMNYSWFTNKLNESE